MRSCLNETKSQSIFLKSKNHKTKSSQLIIDSAADQMLLSSFTYSILTHIDKNWHFSNIKNFYLMKINIMIDDFSKDNKTKTIFPKYLPDILLIF